jgi:pilus assembly protein FimV
VRKSFLKAFGFYACFAWSSMACAVGFGGINVTSSLGQPLLAEIELVAVERADKSSLNAHLASPDAFKGAGIDYPYSLPKLKFQVETRANGTPYIKLSSDQVVNEPFVSLLLELTWSSGRLMREYTFLLDPPGFVAEQPPVAAVKPIEPVVAAKAAPAEIVPEVAPLAEVAIAAPTPAESIAAASAPQAASAVAATEPVATEAASAVAGETAVAGEVQKSEEPKVEPIAKETPPPPAAETAVAKPKEVNQVAASPITVKRGDTLSKIANQTKSSDVSLERMLVALYRANADEFEAHNMNRIKTGKILRLPEAGDLAKINQAEAVKEIHAQVADWNEYRQKLAAAKTPVEDHTAKQEVAGKISTSIAEKTPVAKESAKEVLKVSKGEAPGDQATGGKAKAGQEKANAKVEDSIAKDKALKDAQDRTALLEKNVKEMQRLVELKAQADKEKKAAASSPAPANALPLVAAPASAVKPASGVAETKPKVASPKVIAPPPSLVDELLHDPIYLGGGAAVLLGLAGLGFAVIRKKKGGNKKLKGTSGDQGDVSGRIAAPVQSSPDTGDFTHTITAMPATTSDSDEVDPIGEADLFLNFGRDVQAEEVLKEALQKDPGNNPVKLKLLSIYATRKDSKSFYVYALEIKESGDQNAWSQAAAMGRELEPSNALYGASDTKSEAVVPPAENAANPSVDLDLGFDTTGSTANTEITQKLGGDKPAPAPVAPSAPSVGESTAIMSSEDIRSAQDTPMDFDITGTHPGTKAFSSEDPALNVHAMDFDVSGAHPSVNSTTAEKEHLDVPAMDFDVTGGAALPNQPPIQAPALNLDDLVFDVSPKATPAAKPAVQAPAPAANKGMEFTLDFPTDTKPATPAAQVKDVGLGDISLNLDGPAAAAPPASGTKDEQWQEVATKLDLAKAYQEMGDQAGAREILEEVLRDGDDAQRAAAQGLLQQLV